MKMTNFKAIGPGHHGQVIQHRWFLGQTFTTEGLALAGNLLLIAFYDMYREYNSSILATSKLHGE